MIDQMVKTLDGLFERNASLIAQANSGNLGNPTPCAELDVRGVINHLIGGAHLFRTIVRGESYDPGASMPDLVGDDPSGSFLVAREALFTALNEPENLQRTWKFPWGEMDAASGMGVMLLEAAVHGWDLAKGLDANATIDPQLATMLLEGAKRGIPDEFRSPTGSPFAPAIEVGDDASPTDKLVAFLGRQP